jgi:large subunit ribosomal protein L6
MGRIGRRVLAIPAEVEIKIDDGKIQVKGPKGTLTQEYLPVVKPTIVGKMKVEDQKFYVLCETDDRKALALQGTYNALVKNMIAGVTNGFQKELDLIGIGYRASMQGKKLQIQVGYSHPVEFEPAPGIEFAVAGNTRVIIKGPDRQQVGQVAAEIRKTREVEPYKGKGIKYKDEVVRRKAGKAAKAAAGGTAGA